MYCLILIVSVALATAAPRMSRNCYTLCDLQKSHPANAVPLGCNCSLSDLLNAESASQEITLLDDTGVYFVPAEVGLSQTYFTPQPFHISNPVKFNPRIKKGSVANEEFSEESSERIETYERRQTLIRINNYDESQPSSYLDLEIQDVASSDLSAIQQDSFIPTLESAEQAIVECLDLHILDLTRKYGSVEDFNEFWEARNLQTYEDLSNSDINEKIKKYCSDTEFLIEQILQDIKRGVPKKKTNFRYAHEHEDDLSIKHEIQGSAESAKYNLENIDSKFENLLESSSSLGPIVDNIKESKKINIISNKTSPTPINTVKVYDTELEMDTMPSEVIYKTTNKSLLDETASFPISITPLSDVLLFEDTSNITEKSLTEIQEELTSQGIAFNLITMPFGVDLKFNDEINKADNEIITNEPISTLDTSTTFPTLTTSLSEVQSLEDTGVNTRITAADRKERTNESIAFVFDTIPSEGNFKPNLESRKSNISINSDEILGNVTFSPASTKPRYKERSLGNKSSKFGTLIAEKQEKRELVLNTMLPEIIIKSNNVTNNSNLSMSSQDSVYNNKSFRPVSTTQKYKELSLEDVSSNSETFTPKKHGGDKYEGAELDLDTMPSEIMLKPSNENVKLNVAGIKPSLDSVTFLHASTTTQQNEPLSLGRKSKSVTLMAGKESQAKGGGQELNLNTINSNKPSNEINKHANVADSDNEPKSDEFTYFPTSSTTQRNKKQSLGNIASNSATSMSAKPKDRVKGKKKILDIMPAGVDIKSKNKINVANVNIATDVPILDSVAFFPVSTTPQNEIVSLGDKSSNSGTPMPEKEADSKNEDTNLAFYTTPSVISLKPSNDIFKPHLNVASNKPILIEGKYFPVASTSPQNEKVSVENDNSSTDRSIIGLQEKSSDRDINIDLNTMASNVILNKAGSEPIPDETSKFITASNSPPNTKPFNNINIDTVSNITSDEKDSVDYISTTPVSSIQHQRRKFRESEVQIPKIITKECLNEVQSFVTDNEALPNNDFEPSDATTKSLQWKDKLDHDYSELTRNSSIAVTNTTVVINDNYISGNLYFGSTHELVPVRLLQTDNGKISLGIDGDSLCKKLLQKPNSKSLLLSTLCDFAFRMSKNNTTFVSQ